MTWTHDSAGPVIGRPPVGIRSDRFRDPFVWRDGDGWAMLVGAGTTRARGVVLLYRSDDLCAWRYVGPFVTTDEVVAATHDIPVDDIDSPCWECPQLVRLDDVDILIVSIVDRAPRIRLAHVVALTGKVDGERSVVGGAQRLEIGPRFRCAGVGDRARRTDPARLDPRRPACPALEEDVGRLPDAAA